MPSSTFFHLPESKKTTIITAAKAELTRVGFSAISINKIIQDAGISRGSFYMYFQDKQDLIDFLMSDYKQHLIAFLEVNLQSNHGDLLATVISLHDFLFDHYTDRSQCDLYRNMMEYIESNSEHFIAMWREKQPFREAAVKLVRLVDPRLFKHPEQDDLISIAYVAFEILRSSLFLASVTNTDKITSRQRLANQLGMLANGAYRTEWSDTHA